MKFHIELINKRKFNIEAVDEDQAMNWALTHDIEDVPSYTDIYEDEYAETVKQIDDNFGVAFSLVTNDDVIELLKDIIQEETLGSGWLDETDGDRYIEHKRKMDMLERAIEIIKTKGAE